MNETNRKINTWHEEAMDFAEMAFFAQRRGEAQSYWKFIQRALNYEKAAARTLKDNLEAEPSRTVLYQGAVHFALNLDNFDEARKLLDEVMEGNPPEELKRSLEELQTHLERRARIRERTLSLAQGLLEGSEGLDAETIERALDASTDSVQRFFRNEPVQQLLNRLALKVTLESKNLVSNPEYQIFESQKPEREWVANRRPAIEWTFWDAYKKYLDAKGIAAGTITKLDHLTEDILNRIGDPQKPGAWDKRGMIVGDVQSGKTSNYIGLINKAADAGFRIIVILSGLYENLRQQTQDRVDEGFIGAPSEPDGNYFSGVEKYRPARPVHPLTHSGDNGDIRLAGLRNLPLNTNDYYVVVCKKNPKVLSNLLRWLYTQGRPDGDYHLIKDIPLLIIDDEADYASINVDKKFVSTINKYIRGILSLFDQSAFIGYTATPFANVFISDGDGTADKDFPIGKRRFRLGEDLLPRDFIINIPPPSNYIGYTKIFNTSLDDDAGNLPMINIVDDFEPYIPQGHLKGDTPPDGLPQTLKDAVLCFILVCAIRLARGQAKEHNSMLVHVSWYVNWINHIAGSIDEYLQDLKNKIRYDSDGALTSQLEDLWKKEFQGRTTRIAERLGYEDPRLMEHSWEEIAPCLTDAAEKIEVRAVHGPAKDLTYENSAPLDYNKHPDGLSVIAVGGNKLSRGLTLEGLSISYFLRATRFYDTLLQMGRWFGYRPGYADLCRLFTTKDLVTWYQFIANATEELKEQFDIMELAERTPKNFGFKVRTAPGMLMISSATKIKGAVDLNLSYSGLLLETYVLSKSPDILRQNMNALGELVYRLGTPSGRRRQGQRLIWENIPFSVVRPFLHDFKTTQPGLKRDFIIGYISNQLVHGDLTNWTVVIISNSIDPKPHPLSTAGESLSIGRTMRKEEEEEKEGVKFVDPVNYIIRNSHIISPPHEYLDMDETDERFVLALDETIANTKASNPPSSPGGKYIRQYRGRKNVLLLIYVLDPEGFGGQSDLPAVGYALSLPKIDGDTTYPYKVNQQFLKEFEYAAAAEERPGDQTDI